MVGAGHRAQAKPICERDTSRRRSHYEALQAFPELPGLIASDGLRACQAPAGDSVSQVERGCFLGLSAAFAAAAGRRRLWPPPFEVWYTRRCRCSWPPSLYGHKARALPIFVLGLGTVMACLGGSGWAELGVGCTDGSPSLAITAAARLGLRAFAVGAICYLVIYHFNPSRSSPRPCATAPTPNSSAWPAIEHGVDDNAGD